MSGFFRDLGRKVGPSYRKGVWIAKSLSGDEKERLDAEVAVGRDLWRAMRGGLTLGTPEDLVWVEEVGRRLKARLKDKRREFHWDVFVDEAPNAFALPGGFIFVSTGLLSLADREDDELAAVLGHEMAHVLERHAFERVLHDATVGVALRALPAAGAAGPWVRSAGAKLLKSAYSRKRELIADRIGVALCASAGFDPKGALRMFERLAEASTDPSRLGEYFSTHPPFAVRIQSLRERLEEPS